jgi:hypothetical protein
MQVPATRFRSSRLHKISFTHGHEIHICLDFFFFFFEPHLSGFLFVLLVQKNMERMKFEQGVRYLDGFQRSLHLSYYCSISKQNVYGGSMGMRCIHKPKLRFIYFTSMHSEG